MPAPMMILSLAGVTLALVACTEAPLPTLSVAEQLGNQPDAGFARADRPRAFVFPGDHGPHPDYRNEWWYFTGNLDAPDGRRFGFQARSFASASRRARRRASSAWATSQAWMAHLAVSDAATGNHRGVERFARGRGRTRRRDRRAAARLARGLDAVER